MTKLYIVGGPETGQSFELREGETYLGRSRDNHIKLKDRSISRKHVRIIRRGDRYFLTDLASKNGTFLNGKYLGPNEEVEVGEGVPIAIGMTVICLGEGCLEYMMPLLDSIGITPGAGESGVFMERRDRTNQKKLELIYKVSEALEGSSSIKESLETVLSHILDLLRRIDRGAFILVDPATGEIRDIIFKARRPGDEKRPVYCEDVVNRVLRYKSPFAMSASYAREEDEIADTLKLMKVGSVMCVPMMSGAEITGVIYVDSLKNLNGFRQEDISLFTDLGKRTGQAVEGARMTSEILMVADELTPENG
ncbi:MAG: FHA domain-containing protein [Desulfobacteraceae bacterium]|jgi:hypothetical protein